MLKYKTRGNSSPNFKSNILIVYHSDDKLYSDRIGADILKQFDSVIVFCDESDLDSIDLIDIYDIKAVAFVVTKKFLDCFFDNIIDIKKLQGFPILPIMCQKGIVDAYNRIFYGIQYIKYKNISDNYLKDINNFFYNIILNAEQYKHIINSFKRQIFISYRKSNYAYVNELVKLIRSDDRFDYVSIWYDSFLTTGQDYHEELEEEIRKSDLVIMIMTPEMYKGKNFVVRNEYPLIRKHEKSVIPIKFCKTNTLLLKLRFPKLPPIYSIDSDDFKTKIIEILNIADNDENECDNYYNIGLAYFKGIGSVLCEDKGIKYFEKAAESGDLLAIKQLINIFSHGKFADFYNAIHWQNIYINSINDINVLIEEKINKINIYFEFGYSEDAYMIADNIISDIIKSNLSEKDIYINVIKVLNKLLNIYYEMGETKKYIASLKKWTDFVFEYEKKFNEMENDENFDLYLLLLSKTILLNISVGEYKDAEDLCKSIIDNIDMNDDLPLNRQQQLAIVYENMGEIQMFQGDSLEAINYYKTAYSIHKNIYDVTLDTGDLYSLCIVLDNLGASYKYGGDYSTAISFLKTEIDYRAKYFYDEQNILYQSDIATAYEQLGDCYFRSSDLINSKLAHEKSCSIRCKICEKSPSKQNRFAYGLSLLHLSAFFRTDYLMQQLNRKEVLRQYFEYVKSAYQIFGKLVYEEEDEFKYVNALIDSVKMTGTLYYVQKQYDKAIKYYEKALDYIVSAAKRFNSLELERRRALLLATESQIYIETSNLEKGRELLLSASQIYETIISVSNSDNDRFHYIAMLCDLGESMDAGGDVYFDIALNQINILEKKYGETNAVLMKKVALYDQYSRYLRKVGDDEKANQFLRKSLDIYKNNIYENNMANNIDII